jgi:putative DNA primase/helicase
VIFDEAESGDDQAVNRMKNLLSLMRQASSDTGANILKGTQGGRALHYSCRSAFLLSAISAPIDQEADSNRVTLLSLKRRETSAVDNEKNLELIARLASDDRLSARFLNRVLGNLPVIRKNVDTFVRVAARRLSRQRDADQHGALLAGAWALTSRELASDEAVFKILDRIDWAELRPDSAGDEGEKVLQTIAHQRVKDRNNSEVVVAQLIATAASMPWATAESADELLQTHGLRVRQRDNGWKLLVAKAHDGVRALAKGSGFESDPWRQLTRIEGAYAPPQKAKREKERFSGSPCRYVEIPIECVLGEDWETAIVSEGQMPAGRESRFMREGSRGTRDH